MMAPVWDIVISALLVLGGVFGLIGSFGLIRLSDPMQRLHAPTKATTLGVGTALIASMLYAWAGRAELSWQELLVTAFLFVASPLTALYLAKVHLFRPVERDRLPPTGTDRDWASFDPTDTDPPQTGDRTGTRDPEF